jgi:hypothetical protein
MRSSSLADEIGAALESGPDGLTRAALLIGRVESPHIAFAPALAEIDELGARADARIALADRPAAIGSARSTRCSMTKPASAATAITTTTSATAC